MIKISTPLGQVDTTALFTIGTRTEVRDTFFDSLNTYEYHPGGQSTSVGSIYNVVTWRGTGSVTAITTSTRGQVGVAMGTIRSHEFGWYLVKGIGWALCGDRTSSGTGLYASGTAGCVGDRATLGAFLGSVLADAAGTPSSGGTVKVSISYPVINGAV